MSQPCNLRVVLFKFVVVDLRKNKDQEEGAIKV